MREDLAKGFKSILYLVSCVLLQLFTYAMINWTGFEFGLKLLLTIPINSNRSAVWVIPLHLILYCRRFLDHLKSWPNTPFRLLQLEAWSVPTYHEELDVEANFEDWGGWSTITIDGSVLLRFVDARSHLASFGAWATTCTGITSRMCDSMWWGTPCRCVSEVWDACL